MVLLGYYRRRRGFGHLFGAFFLFRHPILLVVAALMVLAAYLYLRRR